MSRTINYTMRRRTFFIPGALITLLAFSLPVASRAQSGGPEKDHGIVNSIDDTILELQGGDDPGTRTYKETENTQYLGKNGQTIDEGDVVGKYCEVRLRWVTGGKEVLSIQIASGGGNSRAARHDQDAGSSRADDPIVGRWEFPMDQIYTFKDDGTFSVQGQNAGTWKFVGMSQKTLITEYHIFSGGSGGYEVVTLTRGEREGREYESGHVLRLERQMRIKKLADRAGDDFSGSSNSRSTTETRPSRHSSESGDQVLRGTIGGGEAVFRLRLEDGSVSGSYSQGGKSYRIEGTYTPGHMSLNEYTGEQLTAHIKLTLDDLETYWTGTMSNVYPNKNQYPVKLARPQ